VTAASLLGPGWVERVVRLAIGVSPVDALGRNGPLPGLELCLERVPRPHPVPAGTGEAGDYAVGAGLPCVIPGPTGRFAITYLRRNLASPVAVRLFDPQRRYVPRRVRIPLLTEAQVVAEEQAHDVNPWPPVTSRVVRPALFPGAAYGTPAGATIVRGRVLRSDGSPARWTRVRATSLTLGTDLGWAHGDDRGEFLLVIGSTQAQLVDPPSSSLDVSVTVAARPLPLAVDTPAGSTADPLWDLEIEDVHAPGTPDPVSGGRTLPPGFTSTVTATVTCIKGRVTRPGKPFVVP
jgi:hypothetical protein